MGDRYATSRVWPGRAMVQAARAARPAARCAATAPASLWSPARCCSAPRPAAGSPARGQAAQRGRRSRCASRRRPAPTGATAVRRAGLRRHRHHRLRRAARALRLLPPASPARCYPSGRVIVLGTPPEACAAPREAAAAQQALEGFARSVGKEFGRGITAQLVQVAPGAESSLESTLRFLLSARSAYVSGQVLRIGPAAVAPAARTGTGRWRARWRWSPARPAASARPDRPGAGARRGARGLSRRAGAGDALAEVANEHRRRGAAAGSGRRRTRPRRLAGHLAGRHGRARRPGAQRRHHPGQARWPRWTPTWDAVLDVNLAAQERINRGAAGREA